MKYNVLRDGVFLQSFDSISDARAFMEKDCFIVKKEIKEPYTWYYDYDNGIITLSRRTDNIIHRWEMKRR